MGAGEALTEYLDITRRAGQQLSGRECQGIMSAILRHLALREEAGLPWIPKMHLMVHLAYINANSWGIQNTLQPGLTKARTASLGWSAQGRTQWYGTDESLPL